MFTAHRSWMTALFVVSVMIAVSVAACTTGGETLTGAPATSDAPCGEKPELPYVCADGVLPCKCVEEPGCAPKWECTSCAPVDCKVTPNDPLCKESVSCVGCHGLASGPNSPGIENSHPWSPLSCTVCHGGDGSKTSKDEAHVPMPKQMIASGSLPNRADYDNHYLALAGVERMQGGTAWIRFVNPGDLRVVEQSCASDACHKGAGEKVRRSTMNTIVGKLDAMLEVTGARRDPALAAKAGNDSFAKHLATYGAASVHDPSWDRAKSPPGSVPGLKALTTFDRESDKPFGTFTEEDLLHETWNKLCGHCHLGNKGKNDQYGNFRSSGCSACHMAYDYSGRSQSGDTTIPKDEPRLPAAYDHIQYPERPHPIRHQITRRPEEQQCIACHQGSARLTLQFQGIRVDDNRDLTRAKQAGSDVRFRYSTLVDNTKEPQARFRGNTQDQLIEYEDLDEDGQDDTPADVHYLAGMTCIDCHTAADMHGDGNIYSRQDQEVKARCTHCHGNLEAPADPDADNNSINALARATGKKTRKYLHKFDRAPAYGEEGYPYVKLPGIWLKTKSRGEWKYTPQIAWGVRWDPKAQECIGEGRNIDPRTGGFACSPNASIAHGRYNGLSVASGDLLDGSGPRPGVEVVTGDDGRTDQVRFGFSHLGARTTRANDEHVGGIECSGCHGTWHNMRYGAHFGLKDMDGGNRQYDFDRITGQTTLGKQGWFDFDFISMLDLQLGVTSKGKIGRFAPTRLKTFVRQQVLDPQQNRGIDFMSEVLGGRAWKTYRDRTGMGNLFFGSRTGVANAPGWRPNCLEDGYCDSDPNKLVNPGLSHDQNAPHAIQRRAFSCTTCHMDAAAANRDKVGAVYGWNPGGYTRSTSPYLRKIQSVATPHGTYDTSGGYVIADDGIPHRLDWLVDENTGYPLVGNMHVRIDRDRPGIPTHDSSTGGPVMKAMIEKLKRVRVNDLRQGR